jgi:hypothetical protein
MDWTKMLAEAGIPEPPGIQEAYAAAALMTAERYERNGQKRAKGTNARKAKKLPKIG